jgi:hypothetical protein
MEDGIVGPVHVVPTVDVAGAEEGGVPPLQQADLMGAGVGPQTPRGRHVVRVAGTPTCVIGGDQQGIKILIGGYYGGQGIDRYKGLS